MVDCGSPQCAQERRNFRKELLSWNKKVPVAVALEQIAEEFGGKHAIQTLLEPFNCLETKEVTDWSPEQDCFYCDMRLPHINDVVSKLAEDLKNGKTDHDNPSIRMLQDLLPYCPQFYTHGLGRERVEASSSSKATASPPAEGEVLVPPPSKPHVELKIPHILIQASKHKKDCTINGKKSYTDEELTAAVHDIRTGKLGTRRAAMLYGIPRSTLRNKIFKLETEDVLQAELDHDSSSNDDALTLEAHSMKLADLMQASAFSYALPPLPFTLPFHKNIDYDEQEEEFERRLELLRRKHNINGSHDGLRTPEHASELRLPLLADLIRRMVEQRLAMERQSASVIIKKEPSDISSLVGESLVRGFGLKNPFLPASLLPTTATCLGMTASSLADIRIPSYKPVNGIKEHDLPVKELAKVYDSGTIGETLKNIIVRSINEKLKFRETRDDSSGTVTPEDVYRMDESVHSQFVNGPVNHVPFSYHHQHSHNAHGSPSPPKRHKKDSDKEKHLSGSSGSKKTRPKRGQYRKYNSQLLMEAVRAVQRGEMSVHRAGSYFGVPHSTLEYKVKERHLLRQKKSRDNAQSQKPPSSSAASSSTVTSATVTNSTSDSNSSSSSITSASASSTVTTTSTPTTSTTSSSSAAAAAAKPESVPLSALGLGSPPKQSGSSGLPWFQHYLNGSPHFDPAMGFFHPGFALSTPASELLRKLQHKVQSKSGTFPQDGSFDFPRPSGVGSLQERFLLFN